MGESRTTPPGAPIRPLCHMRQRVDGPASVTLLIRGELREDVAVRLEPSDTATYCAYKGRASYYSVPDGPRDVAWTYHEPLHDAEPVRDRVCFFDERFDVIVDGQRREQPVTPWSGQ